MNENSAAHHSSFIAHRSSLRLNHRWLPVLLVGLALLQFLLPSAAWLVPLVGLGGIFGLGWCWARALRDGLTARRTIRAPWVQVGDQLEQQFELSNNAIFPALWVEIEECSPDAPVLRRVASVGGGEQSRWRQEMVLWHRGHYRFGPLELRTGDPFGLFTVRLTIPDSHELIVHPPVLDVRLPPRIIPRGTLSGQAHGAIPSQQRAISSATVRAWQPGDPLSHVHWRTTARLDAPYVKSFQREPSGDLWLLVDLDAGAHAGEAPESTLEYAVTLAASLAAGALAQGRAVGLAGWGESPWRVPPARGSGHLAALLRALAELQPAGGRPWATALEQLGPTLGQAAGLLLLTPTASLDWLPAVLRLRQRGLIPTALLLDARTFGAGDAADPQIVRQALAGVGVSAEVITCGVLPAVTRRERYDFFITGHGRAIRRERNDQPEAQRVVITL